jgi:hypothetical protein
MLVLQKYHNTKIEYKSMYLLYIIAIIMSRPIPQTSVGRLIGLTVDNPKYYTASASPPPPLIPISAANNNKYGDNGDELTMLWRNIATLFAKNDNIESDIETQGEATKRCTDEVYQELQELRDEFRQLQAKEEEAPQRNDSESSAALVRKIRKYVNKKCAEVRETVSYGAYNADNEIFDYVNKTRAEFEAKNKSLEDELRKVYEEMELLNETYYRDYEMFMQRENDMMAKLDAAVKQSEATNQRMKDFEDIFMRQIQQARIYADTRVAGDLREEFTRAICREVEYESKETAKLVALANDDTEQKINLLMNQIQQAENRLSLKFSTSIDIEAERVIELNDKMTDLVTRSNEYHSVRYFGLVDEFKTMKQSIGMVDAELSNVKETVDFLKDEVAETSNEVYDIKEEMTELKDGVYSEMDRDYYDLKDYVKHRMSRHERHKHREPALMEEEAGDALQMIADEYDDPIVEYVGPIEPIPTIQGQQQDQQQQEEDVNDEHVIIIDGDMIISEDEEEEFRHT